MSDYYAERLSAERLKKCYDIAQPRIRQYLDAEVEYVSRMIRPGDLVLELGCGYGRVLAKLTTRAGQVIGVDTSLASLDLGRQMMSGVPNCYFINMDAVELGFRDKIFDCVVCIQNGIAAFQVDQEKLIRESIRVTRPGKAVLFSSYSGRFWRHRLKWFEMQAAFGLLGEIDREKTGDGVIVCKDGFKATTVGPDQFLALAAGLNVETRIVEIDESSIFCEIRVPGD
jgi:ubiquinone/menaquinone biosynthesis C-methylase UbiE